MELAAYSSSRETVEGMTHTLVHTLVEAVPLACKASWSESIFGEVLAAKLVALPLLAAGWAEEADLMQSTFVVAWAAKFVAVSSFAAAV